jgi:hypothetical protein
MRDVMDSLPAEILPSAQEMSDMQVDEEGGYNIPLEKEVDTHERDQVEGRLGDMKTDSKNLNEGKKSGWGPIFVERRSTRIREDGRTTMEKAKDNKKKEDLEENYTNGKKRSSKPMNDKHLLHVVKSVGVDLGSEVEAIEYNLKACCQFDDNRNSKKAIISERDNTSDIMGGVMEGTREEIMRE